MHSFFEITNLRTVNSDELQEAVVAVQWNKKAFSNNGSTALFKGETILCIEDKDPKTFIPYADLDKETVIGWIEASMNDTQQTYINKFLEDQLLKSDVKDNILPWSE